MTFPLNSTDARLTDARLYGEPAAGAGTGTVTSVGGGNGIVATPSPIVAAGSLDLGPLTADWNAGNFVINSQNSTAWRNVVVYGADPTGVANSTAAVIAALAVGNGVIYFPRGTYLITPNAITISLGATVLRGDVYGGTIIKAAAGVAGPVFNFSNGASTLVFCGISDMTFLSTDLVTQKTMIRLSDCSTFFAERITSSDNNWKGASSIGFQLRGRHEIRIRDCEIYTDLPVVVEANPNYATYMLDHSSFEGCHFVVTAALTNPCISITGNSAITNIAFRDCAFVRGGGAIKLNGTAATQSQEIVVENCRNEQTAGAAQYAYDFGQVGSQLQNLRIQGCTFDGNLNGIKLRNVGYSTLSDIIFSSATKDALNVDNTVSYLNLHNFYYGSGATVTGLSSVLYGVVQTGVISTNGAPALNAFSSPVTFGLNTPGTRAIDLSGTQRFRGIAAPTVSEANSGTIYFDSALNKYRVSMNGGAYVDLVGSAGLTGSGTATKLGYWTAATVLAGAANIYVDAVNHRFGIKVAVPLYPLDIDGDVNLTTGSVVRVNALTVLQTVAASDILAVGGDNGAALGTASTAVGRSALNVGTGINDTAVGNDALLLTTTGQKNTAVGQAAGAVNTTGSNNVLLGAEADVAAGNLSNAVAIGYQASVAASDSMSLGNASMKVGIRTSTPKQAHDVNGAVATRQLGIALVNGLNSNIALTETSWVRFTGPTGVFSVGGFTGGTDGRHLTIRNTVAFQMTVVNADAGSAAANQILTPTGGNVNCSVANFIYDDTDDLWILTNYF
jgi:hypothetical protein